MTTHLRISTYILALVVCVNLFLYSFSSWNTPPKTASRVELILAQELVTTIDTADHDNSSTPLETEVSEDREVPPWISNIVPGDADNNRKEPIYLQQLAEEGDEEMPLQQQQHEERTEHSAREPISFDEMDTTVLERCGGKIDFVVTWANGSDSRRLQLIFAHWGRKPRFPFNRWREYGSLYYALLSLDEFAPWTNKIHILTSDNQVPSFLEEGENQMKRSLVRKIEMVNDADIWPDVTLLPSFNSHAFEAVVHRISGLSECYVYICDDFFLFRPASPSDFFSIHPDGRLRPVVYIEDWGAKWEEVIQEDLWKRGIRDGRRIRVRPRAVWMQCYVNSWLSLYREGMFRSDELPFNGTTRQWTGQILTHSGRPMLKSQVDIIWSRFDFLMRDTLKARFRSAADANTFGLYYWWADTQTDFRWIDEYPSGAKFVMMGEEKLDVFTQRMGDLVHSKDYLWVCVNDDLKPSHSQDVFTDVFNLAMALHLSQDRVYKDNMELGQLVSKMQMQSVYNVTTCQWFIGNNTKLPVNLITEGVTLTQGS